MEAGLCEKIQKVRAVGDLRNPLIEPFSFIEDRTKAQEAKRIAQRYSIRLKAAFQILVIIHLSVITIRNDDA